MTDHRIARTFECKRSYSHLHIIHSYTYLNPVQYFTHWINCHICASSSSSFILHGSIEPDRTRCCWKCKRPCFARLNYYLLLAIYEKRANRPAEAAAVADRRQKRISIERKSKRCPSTMNIIVPLKSIAEKKNMKNKKINNKRSFSLCCYSNWPSCSQTKSRREKKARWKIIIITIHSVASLESVLRRAAMEPAKQITGWDLQWWKQDERAEKITHTHRRNENKTK